MRPVLAAVGLALTATAHGAIVYGVGPGWRRELIQGGDYIQSIDIDADGHRDFFTSVAGGQSTLVPTGNNRVLSLRATLPDLGWTTVAMTGGELIGGAPTFGEFLGIESRLNMFHVGGAVIYQCNGRVPVGEPEECVSTVPAGNHIRYFGTEFYSGGIRHYGWISVSIPVMGSDHLIDVNGWAYDTDPDQALFAGAIPEPSTAALIGGSTLLLWQRNATNRKENKALQRTPRGWLVSTLSLIRKCIGFGGAHPRP
jgi:hypothetical protein